MTARELLELPIEERRRLMAAAVTPETIEWYEKAIARGDIGAGDIFNESDLQRIADANKNFPDPYEPLDDDL